MRQKISLAHELTVVAGCTALLFMGGLSAIPARAQTLNPVRAVAPVTAERSVLGISYAEGPSLSVEFAGTARLPKASGEAKVERKKGMTEIELELDEMKPAQLFGGDLATYVLWVVSPEGQVDNAGEFVLQGNRGKLNVSTPLQTFGMFVSAEPHFLVDRPSTFIVLENSKPRKDVTSQILRTSMITYKGWDNFYKSDADTLANFKESKGEIRTDVLQARMSLKLAERAGALTFATEEMSQARAKYDQLMAAAESNSAGQILMAMGHDVVRLAVDAETKAKERRFDAALQAERDAKAQEISNMQASINDARNDAERARLVAEQRQMQIELEQRARERMARDLEQKLNAEAAKRRAAESDAMAAKADREQMREQMRNALSKVVEVRETARGLIVNLPDILFDFDRATLRTEARETLSKVCGILSVTNHQDLAIEGHTDSVGDDAYNMKLSRERAAAVETYLSSCGIPDRILSSEGLGESRPIAENNTAEGRQQNRRVEIVISDTAVSASNQ